MNVIQHMVVKMLKVSASLVAKLLIAQAQLNVEQVTTVTPNGTANNCVPHLLLTSVLLLANIAHLTLCAVSLVLPKLHAKHGTKEQIKATFIATQ